MHYGARMTFVQIANYAKTSRNKSTAQTTAARRPVSSHI